MNKKIAGLALAISLGVVANFSFAQTAFFDEFTGNLYVHGVELSGLGSLDPGSYDLVLRLGLESDEFEVVEAEITSDVSGKNRFSLETGLLEIDELVFGPMTFQVDMILYQTSPATKFRIADIAEVSATQSGGLESNINTTQESSFFSQVETEDGAESFSATRINANSLQTDTETEALALGILEDKSKTFDFTATRGFETGLKKLAKLDGRLAGISIPTVDWGDGTITRALFANCQGLLLNDCEVWGSHLYDKPGNYTVKVSVRLIGRTKKTIKPTGTARVSPVRDFVIVSIGDSYYSGEGAPFKRLSALYGSSHQALWDEPSYYDGGPPWSSSNGNIGTKKTGLVTSRSCHRSAISGSRIAARMIAPVSTENINEQNNDRITHIHMACSGADVGYGVVKPDSDFGSPIEAGDRDTFGYINEQLAWVRTRVPKIDVLLMSGGGNNVGFADKVQGCVWKGRDEENPKQCPSEDDSKEDSETGERYFGALENDYRKLAAEIDCRNDENDFGALCAQFQFTTSDNLVANSISPSILKNVSYLSSNGRKANTVGSKIVRPSDGNGGFLNGCYNFHFDTVNMELSMRSVEVSADSCGLEDQGLDNTIPFGTTMYLRSDIDGWNDVPPRGQRFIHTGESQLEAEFWITWGDSDPVFKVASLEEMLIPAVSLINHYPDATRNKDGGDMTEGDLRACTNALATPGEWNDIHNYLVLPLQNTINRAAEAFNWEVITMEKASKHGLCTSAGDRWIVGLGQSLVRQGDELGTAHPNEAGQRYYGERIYKTLREVSPPRTTATAVTTDGQPYIFDTVTSKDVVVTLEAINPIADLVDLDDSGKGETYYAINSYTDAVDGSRCAAVKGTEEGCTLYEEPFTISEPGIHSVSFFTYNHAGKPERRVWPVTVEINRDLPEMTCSAVPQALWPPNGKMQSIEVAVTAEDEESGVVDFVLAEILDSEGSVAEDVAGFDIGTPDVSGEMRASRLGNGTDRTYTLVYESSDEGGNVGSCSVEVVVPHDQRRKQ